MLISIIILYLILPYSHLLLFFSSHPTLPISFVPPSTSSNLSFLSNNLFQYFLLLLPFVSSVLMSVWRCVRRLMSYVSCLEHLKGIRLYFIHDWCLELMFDVWYYIILHIHIHILYYKLYTILFSSFHTLLFLPIYLPHPPFLSHPTYSSSVLFSIFLYL